MNIYVSNLGTHLQSDELKDLFTPFGEVSSAKVITDRFTNESRGFGFVEMPDDSSAQSAINSLNGTSIQNQSIRVSEARPREEKPNSYNKRY